MTEPLYPGQPMPDDAPWQSGSVSPGRGKGTLIALIAAVAVLLVLATIGVTRSARFQPTALAAVVLVKSTTTSTKVFSATTTAVTTAGTVVSVTVTPSTSPSRSLAPRSKIPAVTGPTVTCRNGLMGIKGHCSAYRCWDSSFVTERPCPGLTGVAGLEWIYPPVKSADLWTCVPLTDKAQYGTNELEVAKCGWSDLPGLAVYLSRWKDNASAKTYLTGNFGQPVTWTPTIDGKQVQQGLAWNPPLNAKKQLVNAELFDKVPYSVLAIAAEGDGAGAARFKQFQDRAGVIGQDQIAFAIAAARP